MRTTKKSKTKYESKIKYESKTLKPLKGFLVHVFYSLKICVEIRISEKVLKNTYNIV